MAKELKIYFAKDEETLYEWLTKTYPGNKGKIIKELLKTLKENGPGTGENTAAEKILANHFSDIIPNEQTWISEMLNTMPKTELANDMKSRISFIFKTHPTIREDLKLTLKKTYPNLSKLVKL